jgi:hypothetical protein
MTAARSAPFENCFHRPELIAKALDKVDARA